MLCALNGNKQSVRIMRKSIQSYYITQVGYASVLNRSHEQMVSFLSWAGDASPSALFELARVFFLCVCFAATQLAHQLHPERTQVVCSNKVARKAWLAGTPTMDQGLKVKGKQISQIKEK